MMLEKKCYCGSDRLFADCCGPLIEGSRPAATAEALMRSRYTANVLKDTEYLLRTYHVSTRPHPMDAEAIPVWSGLTIVSVRQGLEGDEHGIVEFRALYRNSTGLGVLHEKSRFVFEGGCWFYVDGELIENGVRQAGKTGRNAPCLCGSGEKYKKCCLQ